jgi:hypothetical protein
MYICTTVYKQVTIKLTHLVFSFPTAWDTNVFLRYSFKLALMIRLIVWKQLCELWSHAAMTAAFLIVKAI